ncbi:MAG TPA: hypothetical protein EYP21_08885 [Syntrophaceae bacterium]|nr:hypothetical protein [Syntrophaceae bacterium]
MITSEIGYIRITRFAEKTGQELEAALDTLEAQGMRRLLLDLRMNSGGLLPAAVAVAEKFLEKGQRMVYTRGRGPGTDEDYFANPSPGEKHPRLPLIVMINHGSASASEIVSGAIQDWDRGLIVGQTSFGKGLVQGQFPLQDGSRLLLTISRYYTPSGRLIQRPYKGETREEYIREGYEDVKQNTPADTSGTDRPAYATLILGRTVYGGGGITPDVILAPDLLTPFEVQLRQERAFPRYADRYVGVHDSFGHDFGVFLMHYQVSDEMLKEFEGFVKERLVRTLADSVEAHRRVVRRGLERAVLRRLAAEQGVQRKDRGLRGSGFLPIHVRLPFGEKDILFKLWPLQEVMEKPLLKN